jgi:maltose alpha-D-glucosyltransferase/alpha-amylase
VIFAMLFTMPGIPFIYYGDEIGMRYLENLTAKEGSYQNRTGSRTPMQWTNGKNCGFSTADKKMLYIPVDSSPQPPNAESQLADDQSLIHLVRRLLGLRKKYPALGNTAEFEPVYAKKGKYPFVYERRLDGACYWIAINPSEKELSIKLPAIASAEALEVLDCNLSVTKNASTLKMGGVSFGIFGVSKTQ